MSNKYLRSRVTPNASTETLLYAPPAANVAVLPSLRVTNAGASSTLLDVRIYPGGGATATAILHNHLLPVNATMDVFSGVPCVLETGDELKVRSTSADVDFYLSYLEIDRT